MTPGQGAEGPEERAPSSAPSSASSSAPSSAPSWAPSSAPSSAPSPGSARGWRGRLWIYALVFSAAIVATLLYFHETPASRLADLVSAVNEAGGTKRVFLSDGGFLTVFPQRGYVLTLYVGDSERCRPAQYLTLRRMDDEVLVDLMIPTTGGPGADEGGGEQQLRGADLDRYLARVGISRRGFERTLERHYSAAPAASGG